MFRNVLREESLGAKRYTGDSRKFRRDAGGAGENRRWGQTAAKQRLRFVGGNARLVRIIRLQNERRKKVLGALDGRIGIQGVNRAFERSAEELCKNKGCYSIYIYFV